MSCLGMRYALVLAVWTARSITLAGAQPADWAPHRDAFDPQVIARYEQQVAADPFDARALAKLARLFTGRHTSAELEQRLGEDRAAGLIARAQLHRTRNDPAGALALYERAAALEPDGPFAAKSWLAIAQLHRDRGELGEAQAAYERVLAAGPPPALAVAALRPLADLAAIAKQPAADTYFVQLLANAPDDPELWLARGDALVARDPRLAADSFARAEELVARDLPRRLDAIARRADALDRASDPAAAQAEYWRAVALAPKNGYVAADLLGRIAGVARRAHELPALRAQLQHDWPEQTRGYLEWSTLGGLAKELGDRDAAIAELQHAARLAPWELATQRTLIELLAAAGTDPRDQLRAAIRAAPGEPTLQLDLARRTWPNETALAMLDRTAQQFARDASVVVAVARQLVEWDRPARAERWFEAVARLEPDDDDLWIALVEAYFGADDHRGAMAAWKRVSRPRPGALLRFAGVLLDEHDNEQALHVIDESIAIDGLNPEAWRLRSNADEERGDLSRAIEDALRELSLSQPDRAVLRHARHHVVRLLVKTRPGPDSADDDDPTVAFERWNHYLTRWRDAFWSAKPDLDAGYLYLEAVDGHGCFDDLLLSCADAREAVERLVKLVPDDPDLLRTEARIYEEQGLYEAAAARLERVLVLEPRAAPEIREQIDRLRSSVAIRDDSYVVYHEASDGTATVTGTDDTAEPDRTWSTGLAIDYGATVHGSLGGSIGLGAYVHRTLGSPDPHRAFTFAEARVDWTQQVSAETAAAAAGVWRSFDALSAASLSLGIDERAELRFGDPMAGAALATDVGAVLALYEAPLELGVRVEQWYAGSAATRALLEIRVRLF